MREQNDNNRIASVITLSTELSGKILDVGGGGEGIIGRLYQSQVTAIDNNKNELEEAPDGYEKLLMDATSLEFKEQTFQHITFFFSLMYMTFEEQEKAIQEAARVCKKDGVIHIWDCEIESVYPEPFLAELTINLPCEIVTTTYGIIKKEQQSIHSITAICKKAGLTVLSQETKNGIFRLDCRKS